MNNKFLYGNPVKEQMLNSIKDRILNLEKKPILKIIQVGNRADSNRYINNKLKSANEVGIIADLIKLDNSINEHQLIELISKLNSDTSVNGIIVQLPLPAHINELNINKAISPSKDVDGFTDVNVGKTLLGLPSLLSCTPLGIMNIFNFYDIDLIGKNICIIGRSNIVGKPMASLLINAGATVTVCNSKTSNLKQFSSSADIVIVAIGKTKFLKSDYFSDGQIIVDVGVNFDDNGKQCGDVDVDNLFNELNNISLVPSPKGCGQTTVGALMVNTLNAYLAQNK